MNSTTKNTIGIARAIGRRGFAVTSVEVHTPDRRAWSIDTTSTGGFRLFEIDLDDRVGPEEHHAADGDEWTAGDLVDYLAAVGQPKPPSAGMKTLGEIEAERAARAASLQEALQEKSLLRSARRAHTLVQQGLRLLHDGTDDEALNALHEAESVLARAAK